MLTDLRNAVNRKKIPKNEKTGEVIDIVEEIRLFNKQQDGSGFKISAPKQMLQRLPITLAQVKAGNTSANLLNEIRRIICSLYRAEEITKKVYSEIMNSIKF